MSTGQGRFWRELAKTNSCELIGIAIANIVILILVISYVEQINLDLVKDILSSSATLLGISTATVVFFGDYVQKTTDWLFRKKDELSQFKGAPKRMGVALLRLIFLQLLLYLTLVLTGGSSILAAIDVFVEDLPIIGVVALALLLAGLTTILLWMSLFVFRNTPGRITYSALNEEIVKRQE
jgi:hypothetical protein